MAAHPAPEQRAHAPARRAARHPRPAAARATSSCCRTCVGQGELRSLDARRAARTARARSASTPSSASPANFTLDATVNPDFGQVEADPSVVNLTAYETFYEEKRPFFLEGRKILELRARGRGPALLLAPHRPGAHRSSPRSPPARRPHARRAPRSSARSRSRARPAAGSRSRCCRASRSRRRRRSSSPLGVARAAGRALGSYTRGTRCRRTGTRATRSSAACSPRPHRLDRTTPRSPRCRRRPDRRARLHPLLRRPRLAARGSARREPRERATREAILALQTNPVHYYQRPDADHLGVDAHATSLARPRRLAALRAPPARGGCGSPTTSTGTRRASS